MLTAVPTDKIFVEYAKIHLQLTLALEANKELIEINEALKVQIADLKKQLEPAKP
jgi:hypothetical protein